MEIAQHHFKKQFPFLLTFKILYSFNIFKDYINLFEILLTIFRNNSKHGTRQSWHKSSMGLLECLASSAAPAVVPVPDDDAASSGGGLLQRLALQAMGPGPAGGPAAGAVVAAPVEAGAKI